MLSVSLLTLLAVLLFATRVQVTSAKGRSRDTTLAVFNAGLAEGFLAGVDARVTALIDQVYEPYSHFTLNYVRAFLKVM